jgi:hypothetical protein
MGRIDIQISRKLLSQWIIRCGKDLKPLYEVMLELILKGKRVHRRKPCQAAGKRQMQDSLYVGRCRRKRIPSLNNLLVGNQ